MSVENVLTTIAACTGAGAFVDFYIGKDGQKHVKDRLETWWYRLSDIPIRAVGREEALNALRVIDYLFGPKLFSWKRLRSAAIFKAVSLSIYPLPFAAIAMIGGHRIIPGLLTVVLVIYDVLVIGVSISLTRSIISLASKVFSRSSGGNIIVVVFLMIFQTIVLLYFSDFAAMTGLMSTIGAFFAFTISYSYEIWSVIKQSINGIMLLLASNFEQLLDNLNPYSQIVHLYSRFSTNPFVHPSPLPFGWALDSINFTGLLLNAGRLLLAVLFFGSYILVPVWPRILTLYARIMRATSPCSRSLERELAGSLVRFQRC